VAVPPAANFETEFIMLRPIRCVSDRIAFQRSQSPPRNPCKICECTYQIWLVKVTARCATLLTTLCYAREAKRRDSRLELRRSTNAERGAIMLLAVCSLAKDSVEERIK
jgi:hypothetical protein